MTTNFKPCISVTGKTTLPPGSRSEISGHCHPAPSSLQSILLRKWCINVQLPHTWWQDNSEVCVLYCIHGYPVGFSSQAPLAHFIFLLLFPSLLRILISGSTSRRIQATTSSLFPLGVQAWVIYEGTRKIWGETLRVCPKRPLCPLHVEVSSICWTLHNDGISSFFSSESHSR